MSSAGSAGLSERSADVGAFTDQITALDQAHALGLTRLAHVMLSDAGAAEDVVQEAFCGLYRNWARRRLRASKAIYEPAAASAESVALTGKNTDLCWSLRKLPARQREVLVLRFYLHESDDEIARVMGISP